MTRNQLAARQGLESAALLLPHGLIKPAISLIEISLELLQKPETQSEEAASALAIDKEMVKRDIEFVIASFESQRHSDPAVAGPLSTTDRQVLAELIFERIFKEE